MSEKEVIVSMKDICKSFPGVKALDHVQFELRSGEVMALLGENGAGKSTLMKILSGVYTRDSGSLDIFGKEYGDLTPKQAQALAETMRLLCSELENSNMMSSQDSNIQEEMLQEMYLTVHKENKSFYSLKEERKLQQLIRTGSKQEAQQQLKHMLLD